MKRATLFGEETQNGDSTSEKAGARPWDEPKHEWLTPLWWLAEFLPKMQRRPGSQLKLPRLGLGRHRYIPNGAMIHQSTLRRIRETTYAGRGKCGSSGGPPGRAMCPWSLKTRATRYVPQSIDMTPWRIVRPISPRRSGCRAVRPG